MTFVGDLDLRYQKKTGKWMLCCPFSYVAKDREVIVVPTGFITDGASIPKVFWSMIGGPLSGRYICSAVIHDFLCFKAHQNQYSRKRADIIFEQAMREEGATFIKRKVMYLGVRLASIFSKRK